MIEILAVRVQGVEFRPTYQYNTLRLQSRLRLTIYVVLLNVTQKP